MSTEILSADHKSLKDAHTAATTAKTFLLINSVPCMPMNDADANADNVFVYCASKIRVPKATGQAWVPLAKIYWDDTAKNFTTTSTANTFAGYVIEDAASGDTEGVIDLGPISNNA